jgi:hypothetical protein
MVFTLNEKKYTTKKVNFKTMVDLEQLGLSLTDMQGFEKNIFSTITKLLAYECDLSIDDVCVEIDKHLEKGGKISDFTAVIEEIFKSDFFQHLQA